MLYCCANCFKDKFIQNLINLSPLKGNCNFCLTKDTRIIDPVGLRIYFEPLILLYIPVKNFSGKKKKEIKGDLLSQKLNDNWSIFKISQNEIQNILDCIFPDLKGSDFFTEKVDYYKYSLHSSTMLEKELEESWKEFTDDLKSKNRFFPSIELDLGKIELLLQYLDIKLNKGSIFFRARISENEKKILKKNMGSPPFKKARGGRGNPVGIPYLYLASDIETAISEVRPSILDYVTIGKFTLLQELRVIDLRFVSPFNFSLSEDFEDLVFDLGYLKTLGSDLSKPINPRDVELEYLPTQYLCEFIKSKEWDGVLYSSSLAKGYNLALFSNEKVDCYKTSLYHVDKPSYNCRKIR